MKIRRMVGGILNEPVLGRVDDVPRVEALRLIRAKRAQLVPEPSREEKMVPQRRTERMKSR
jgi:hypothetical protein